VLTVMNLVERCRPQLRVTRELLLLLLLLLLWRQWNM